MDFGVIGPIKLSRHGKKRLITADSMKELIEELESKEEGLSEACGCYVFAKQTGKGLMPWYVGQACKRPLAAEALNPSNREKYNTVLDAKGSPVLFFLPLRTPSGKLRKRPKGVGRIHALDFLERWLIAAALERNHKLKNSKETAFLRTIHVTGILNARKGGSTKASRDLSRTLWP
ncbi:hypothetical protein [Lysobacter enzymogenes]|uniref:hypothetical protein n=1 Tax=Lysobacter enzymogenes TaxID=69 RepID=UPI001AF22472|nr:hypothetical protein [Lysobacter enzymogenes]QQP99093.1 hypothetical protein JHW41_13180 [Lysobacter enzymogenes]